MWLEGIAEVQRQTVYRWRWGQEKGIKVEGTAYACGMRLGGLSGALGK